MPNIVRQGVGAFLLVIVISPFLGRQEGRKQGDVQGYVYERCENHRLIGPVGGAVVSTSVDSRTAITDTIGHFRLVTQRPVFNDEYYSMTVQSGGTVVSDDWLPLRVYTDLSHPVGFVLSPGEQVLLGHQGNDRRTSVDALMCVPARPPR